MNDLVKPNRADIEAIERATVAAVAPDSALEPAALPGWLLPFDSGTVNRAKSAVPLLHDLGCADPVRTVDCIEADYRARGLPAIFRLPDSPGFEALCDALVARGYTAGEPVAVQVARAEELRNLLSGASMHEPAQLEAAPDAAWAALFLGPGFDPVDGAGRVAALSRATGSVFASVRLQGQTLGAGAGAYSHGWGSVHGMRTAATHRGQGLAGRVLVALASESLRRGLDRLFLQVEQGNAPALALYRRAGFRTAWTYRYWQRPA